MVSKIVEELAERAHGVFVHAMPEWSPYHARMRWTDLTPAEKEAFKAMARSVITGSVRAAKAHRKGVQHV